MTDDLRILANTMLERVKAQSDALHMVCDLVSFLERRGIAHGCTMASPGDLRIMVTLDATIDLIHTTARRAARPGARKHPGE